MLTEKDLLICDTLPNIKEISLELYKNFAEKYLMGKTFHYTFIDNTELNVKFTESGIYHMLGIQHIDRKIKCDYFFDKITEGLSFADFEKNDAVNTRFKKGKKRITMFACVYNCLKTGTMFYIPSGKVRSTANVKMDYIVHEKLKNINPTGINQNGINIGLRKIDNDYIPLTVLISKESDLEKYIKSDELKLVNKLEIIDEADNVIDFVSYAFKIIN